MFSRRERVRERERERERERVRERESAIIIACHNKMVFLFFNFWTQPSSIVLVFYFLDSSLTLTG